MEQTDILVIGAGPIGIELAACLKHAKADYLHVEAGQIGQTIGWYPKQARFFSSPERIAVAGVPLCTVDQSKATREEYLAYLRSVVQHFDLNIRAFNRVVQIEHDEQTKTFTVHTRRGGHVSSLIVANRLVLAIGDMHHPRLLHVPGEDMSHVSHYFDEPHAYFQQKLLIVGGKNSAIEAALRCHRAGAQVALSYRGESFDENSIKYWLLPEINALIRHKQIDFYPQTQVQRVDAEHVTLAAVAESSSETKSQQVSADFVLLLTGYEQDQTLFDQLGLQREGPNQAPVLNAETYESSVSGVYIAGTATAGTQNQFKVFIENAHEHVSKIYQALMNEPAPIGLINQAAQTYGLAES